VRDEFYDRNDYYPKEYGRQRKYGCDLKDPSPEPDDVNGRGEFLSIRLINRRPPNADQHKK
jgi:hypothetical protein